jgi:hypothetical protein
MQLINKNVYEKRTVEENSTSETGALYDLLQSLTPYWHTASFQGNSQTAFRTQSWVQNSTHVSNVHSAETGAQIAPHSSSSHGYQTRSKPSVFGREIVGNLSDSIHRVKTEHCRTFCSTGIHCLCIFEPLSTHLALTAGTAIVSLRIY